MRRLADRRRASRSSALFLLVPLAAVFGEALRDGVGRYLRARSRDPTRCAAIKLTLLVAAIAVPLNIVFGVAAAWAIARFQFRGQARALTLIDLPLAVSPVIAGMMFVLLFGCAGLLGPWLAAHDIKIIFARARHRPGDDLRDRSRSSRAS